MFALFDTIGARTPEGKHVEDIEAEVRAEERRGSKAKGRKAGKVKAETNSNVMPSLQEEMSTFKAIVREVARHEMQKKDGKMFTHEAEHHQARQPRDDRASSGH